MKLELKFIQSTGETRPIKKSSSSVYVKSQHTRHAMEVEKIFLLRTYARSLHTCRL